MTNIRPFEPADASAIAGLFQRVFRKSRAAPSAELVTYIRQLFLESPGCDPEISSLVHIDSHGDISGFIGVNALRMTYQDTPVRAAICGSLMVEGRQNDPMAGARLLKAFLAGPQDVSFSETASEVSMQMWTRLRGVILPQYSLVWIRVIRPSAFLLDVAATRTRSANLLRPFARGLDHYLRGRIEPDELRWSGIPDTISVPKGLAVTSIEKSAFAELVGPLTAQFTLRPEWEETYLAHVIDEACVKPEYGEPVLAMVTARGDKPIGAFLYHVRRGGIAHVAQILALPGQAANVVDCLVAHATARGAAGLIGRTQPALLEAVLGRRISFIHSASTVIHSRNAELVQAFRDSQGFFNGLAGEYWTRMFGNRFD